MVSQPLAHLDNELVAGGMAERVIDFFEAVDIDVRDDGMLSGSVGFEPTEDLAEVLVKVRAVRQAGKVIVAGRVARGLFLLGKVATYAEAAAASCRPVVRRLLHPG